MATNPEALELAGPTSITHQHFLAMLRSELESMAGIEPGVAQPVNYLEVGCGDGRLMAFISSHLSHPRRPDAIHYSAFDVCDSLTEPSDFPGSTTKYLEQAVPWLDWNDRVQSISIEDPWPFPDSSMDIVVSNQVIEHVADLQAFFGQLSRTLRPGGRSFHVFPLKNWLYEFHLRLPLVNRIKGHEQRTALALWLTKAGLGTYKAYSDSGMTPEQYASTRSDFVMFATNYKPFSYFVDLAKEHGLRISYRYSGLLYKQKLLKLMGKPMIESYRLHRNAITDWAAFMLSRYALTVTLVLEKPEEYGAWRNPGGPSMES